MSVIAPLMTDLLSTALVPLQTLPGWPEAPEVTLVDNLLWIALIPLVVAILIVLIGMAASRGKEDISLHPPTEPITVLDDSHLPSRGIGVGARNETLLEQESGPRRAATDTPKHAIATSDEEPTGGSSARW